MTFAAPFAGQPNELLKVEQRFQGRAHGEREGLMWLFDYNRDSQKRRIFQIDHRNASNIKLILDLSVNGRYNDIGQPVTKTLPNGKPVTGPSLPV